MVSVSIVSIELALNQGPTIGRSPSPGIRVVVAFVSDWSSPAIASVCPSRSSTTVRALRSLIEGTMPPSDRRPLGEVELADDRLDVQPDHVVGQDLGKEGEDRAEPLELDGDHGRSARDRRALRDREREQPADQEPRGLAVECDQVGLGEDLGQAVDAQGVDEQREVPRVEHAEERGVPGGRRRVRATHGSLARPDEAGFGPVVWETAEFAAKSIVALLPAAEPMIDFPASIEPAHADTAGRAPVDLGDLDVQQDLARPGNGDAIDDDQPASRTAASPPMPPPPMPPPPIPPPPMPPPPMPPPPMPPPPMPPPPMPPPPCRRPCPSATACAIACR